MSGHFRVSAPGRVNLIGDHTDYTGGLVMPMTIDRWTVIEGEHRPGPIELTSADEADVVTLRLPIGDPSTVEPRWGRYIAGVAAELGDNVQPVQARITTDIPVGAGLSSSAALELAAALALGFRGNALALAELCRRAEHRASGVPCGIMDQLSIAAGVADHALLIDCNAMTVDPIPLPVDMLVIVRFVRHRTLVGSDYADRVAECGTAEGLIGPLRLASIADVDTIDDALIRRRARHVVTENQRVRDFAIALHAHDLVEAGRLMLESHTSLRNDFEISTPVMDAAVADLIATPGVYGARMTGGGFGGCVVGIAALGTEADGWIVHAVDGASRPQIVLHLIPRTDWESLGTDEPVTNASLASEGFIHCTDDAGVLLQVANAFYRDVPGDFVVLHVEVARLTSACIWEEPAHISGAGPGLAPQFPHVYGPVDRFAVVRTQAVRRDAEGAFVGYQPVASA